MPKRKLDDKRFSQPDVLCPKILPGSDDVVCFLGPSNSGKTFAINKVLTTITKRPQYAILVHRDINGSGDYDTSCFDQVFTDMPTKQDLQYLKSDEYLSQSKVLVIEEYKFGHDAEQDIFFHWLLSHFAKHFNCRVFFSSYSFVQIPVHFRDLIHYWAVFQFPMEHQHKLMKSNLGFDFLTAFKSLPKHMQTRHTYLVFKSGIHDHYKITVNFCSPLPSDPEIIESNENNKGVMPEIKRIMARTKAKRQKLGKAV